MPGAGDWLHSHKERGQSVRSLTRRSIKAWPHATYDTINIVPCGKFTKDESPPLEKLRELMEIWFGCKCQLAKPVSVEDVAVDGLVDGEQLLVRNASNYLKRLRPGRRIFANIMVTMVDLTPGEGWNFVFGQASLSEGWGVFSFARFNPNFYKYNSKPLTEKQKSAMLKRTCKTMVHETGHILGFKHCIYYSCVMNGSNGDHEVSPFKLCPICLQKLYLAIGTNYKKIDLIDRYEKLQQFYLKCGWTKQASWIDARLGKTVATEEKLAIETKSGSEDASGKILEKTQDIKTRVKLVVRERASKASQKIGQISAGETIKIQCPVKMQRTKSGTIRIPLVNGGWVTAQTKSGKALVEEYVCEIHENTPCCDGNEASFQSPTDVLASLKARKASLESTRKRIEETIEKSNAITNAAQEIEEQWKEFQDAFGQMNQAMVEKIGNSLMNDCKMRRILGLR